MFEVYSGQYKSFLRVINSKMTIVISTMTERLVLLQKPPEVFYENRCSLKISQIFTGKHLCYSLLFNKVAGLKPATVLKKRYSGTGGFL